MYNEPLKSTTIELQGTHGEWQLNAHIRDIVTIRAEQENHRSLADVVITSNGEVRHLFRSVYDAKPGLVHNQVLESLSELTKGDHRGSLNALQMPHFVELDPATQVELSGENISIEAIARDLNLEGSNDIHRAFDEMLSLILDDPELLEAVVNDFREVQANELGLISPDTYAKTFPDLSIRPVILDPVQEEKLTRLVSDVITAKMALINSLKENSDLKELILTEMNPLGREVIEANLFILPDHVRIRIDSHTDFEVGDCSQIETNGSAPQGDAVTSVTLSLFKRTFTRLFLKLGASPEQIDNCFTDFRLPLYGLGNKVAEIYNNHKQSHPDLPTIFNVGFFAWKHPTSRKPLSNISNAEAEKSTSFLTDNPSIKSSFAFDPFDIVDFKTLEDTNYHIPIIQTEAGEHVPIHFIRTLYGNLSFNGPTWSVLKQKRPDVFYKFTGIQHDTHNPSGKRIPEWMWMNSLNPCLTDKVLDAILTDPVLRKRFGVFSAITEELKRKDPDLSNKKAKTLAREIIESCQNFIPQTKCLARKEDGLFKGDTGVGGLDSNEIEKIKLQRNKWVIKLDSLSGYAGNGIFVGKSFPLNEVPKEVLTKLSDEQVNAIKNLIIETAENSRFKVSNKDQNAWFDLSREDFFNSPIAEYEDIEGTVQKFTLPELASKLDKSGTVNYLDRARDIIWPYLVEYSLDQQKSLIQKYKEPQIYNAIRFSYDEAKDPAVTISNATPHSVDVNVFAYGTECSDFHSRGSLNGKTNITGGYGARMLVLRWNIARSMAGLFSSLPKS